MTKKLIDIKIHEFITWLEKETDFGDWDPKLKFDVQIKLNQIMKSK